MGEGEKAIVRGLVISGGAGVGLFWGLGLSPETEILEAIGASTGILLLISLLSTLSVGFTMLKAIEYIRFFGLLAWVTGTLGGYSIGIGEHRAGLFLVLLALVFMNFGFMHYGLESAW